MRTEGENGLEYRLKSVLAIFGGKGCGNNIYTI
jgi:hypothetical protein